MSSQLRVYNTLTRSEEDFLPLKDKKVNMFVCGQTVYDDAHLGHAKNYINFDVIARWLRHMGYDLTYVQNITDIDDKIIARAHERNVDPFVLAREYEKRFLDDMGAIGVTASINAYPRSHDYIEDMKDQIQLLLEKGYAYVLDGDIYFDVAKFPDYTRLSGMKLEELEKHRIETMPGKRHTYDFALWKGSKPGEPSWKITVKDKGNEQTLDGRPGWHIEDTAIAKHLFGPQYDLHGGALELIFPHHTNEIAQAEAAFGRKPFVKYWLHSGIMRTKGEKMSKSLRNFISIRQFLGTYDAEVLRLLVCSTHYTKDIEYTEELAKNAQKRLRYLYSSFSILLNAKEGSEGQADDKAAMKINEKLTADFSAAMNDNFNTPLALTHLSNAIEGMRNLVEQKGSIGKGMKEHSAGHITEFAALLGILQEKRFKVPLSTEALSLLKERDKLRQSGKYDEADKIRAKLKKEHGIILEDSQYGTLWYRE
ncbi:MAG: cysteine--tRNA ligase [Candidatus Micrarchaeota archaeon]|nr:cysteine--tRNA ligase [Candidatus Micrarchaeota archaeon]